MARLDAAAGAADTNVLLHPTKSPAVVASTEHVASAVAGFHAPLGIESGREAVSARRWGGAAAEVRDRALETGAAGVHAARRRGGQTLDRARLAKGKVSSRLEDRTFCRRGIDRDEDD